MAVINKVATTTIALSDDEQLYVTLVWISGSCSYITGRGEKWLYNGTDLREAMRAFYYDLPESEKECNHV